MDHWLNVLQRCNRNNFKLLSQVLEERLMQAGVLLQGVESQVRAASQQKAIRTSVKAHADSDEDSDFD